MLIPDLLDAIEDRLKTIDGLNVTDNPSLSPVPPMAVVSDGPIEYHQSGARGHDEITIFVTVYVPKGDTHAGHHEARLFKSGYGDKSIRAAFETSTGVSDLVPNGTFTIARCDTEEATIASEPYFVLRFECNALIPGKES